MEPEVNIFNNSTELSRRAADEFVRLAKSAVKNGNRFAVVLSGGSTPRLLYRLLASEYREKIQWSSVHLFWGDERYVPHDDPQSNYLMVKEALLDHIEIPRENIHPMPVHFSDPEAAARSYETDLKAFFHDGNCRFDLLLLGLGTDGHTASLFPGSPVLREQERWVRTAIAPPGMPSSMRLTLTLPVINNALNVWFLVSGAEKKSVARSILYGTNDAENHYPAAMVKPEGRLVWMVEKNAID